MTNINPLKTSFDLTLTIDDTDFKIVFKPINKHTQKKLDELKEESKLKYEDIDNKRLELKEYKDLMASNSELINTFGENGGITLEDKTKFLLENKEYLKAINSLEKELLRLEQTIPSIDDELENYSKQLFNETVVGEDKLKLIKAIDDIGISYFRINSHIDGLVKETIEKK